MLYEVQRRNVSIYIRLIQTSLCYTKTYGIVSKNTRGVFRTQSNIYDLK